MQRATGPIPPDPTDEVVRRATANLPPAPAALRAHLVQRFAAEQALARRRRALWWQAVAGVAAAAALVVAVLLNLERLQDTLRPSATAGGRDTAAEPAAAPRTDTPARPAANQTDRPQPQPGLAPEPEPQWPPKDTPGPAPDSVPAPVPAPEQPIPPAPPQPAPVVREPEPAPQPPAPREKEPTQAQPEQPRIVLGRLGEGVKARIRQPGGDWADATAGVELHDGTSLSVTRGHAEVWLAGGSLLRFDGEIRLARADKLTVVGVESRAVYADNIGLSEPLEFRAADLSGTLESGVAVATRDQHALELACLNGTATLGGQPVAPGQERRLTARGAGQPRVFAGSRLTRDLPPRVVYREDFDKAPEGGLYGDGETLRDGLLARRGAGNYAAFRYNPTVTVQPGMVLRFAARTRGVSQLQLEVFLDKPHDETCFNMRFRPVKDGQWQVYEIRLADFPDKQNPALKMQPGQLLRNFKLHLEGTPDALVEIDWVEYVRIQEK
ncbi:MAG: hypothetical protein HS108_09315 [Planctomycetes bacterium]|jgi:hypothetical protein|nr:hypothetical protein [Planctomycetota bacterium]MCL4729042.1 hypothetical protein [Planctomycetota bacterium]